MSRVIVKGLPKYFSEKDLEARFAKQGLITTDVQLRRNAQGQSRRFAFIGFKDEQDAENAVKHFNESYIDTCKIQVELAKTFVDPTVPKSWKEKSKERREYLERIEEKLARMEEKKNKRRKKGKRDAIVDEGNKELKEFLNVMKPAVQQKSWNNGMEVSADGAPSTEGLNIALGEHTVQKENESDDEYEDFGKKDKDEDKEVEDEPMMSLTRNTEDDEEQMMTLDQLEKEQKNEKEQGADTEEPILEEKKVDEDIDDMDWFMKHRTRIVEKQPGEEQNNEDQKESSNKETPATVEENAQDGSEPESEPEAELTPEEKNMEKILETGRLFLRNILYSSTEEDFENLFAPFGALKEVHVALDTRTGKSKGFAYVQFENSRDAANAFIELDKQIFQGRLLHILPADVKKDHKLDEFELKNMPLKKQKLMKKKYEASKQDFTWNSLYMNNDAVLDSVASQLGISKQDLIDPMNSSSAVKQALAEAHVIGDVRTYFESKGVDLLKFNTKERDDRIILIKNFQHGTTKEDLGELFAQYGELNRILMPPAGTIAIVEFRDVPSGRAAFNKLSFRRLGKSILYLEKGPKDLFTKPAGNDDQLKEQEKDAGKEIDANAKDILAINEDEEDENGPTTSIFIKNINFATSNVDLGALFKVYPGFILSVIKTKPNPRGGEPLSMGFGFAEFKTIDQAKVAINGLDGVSLDGHKLQLKISTRVNTQGHSSSNKKGSSSKIIVKNLPFEATRKDVFELFNSFGTLKSVRVPKKFDRSARGFAFVEFSTVKEAKGAMDQLQGVHLLGRRLVLDFASLESDDVEDEIEKLTKRAKTTMNSRKMADIRSVNSGKRKLEIDEDEE